MEYEASNNTVRVTGISSFDLGQTLECGQCFRFIKDDENSYTIIAYGRVLHVAFDKDTFVLHPCTLEEFENIWMDYFDLNTDYEEIRERLSASDPVLKEAAAFAPGIRILNQEPWECMISFIISQNKNIPGIQQIIKNISERYGDRIRDGIYAFPTPEQLGRATKEDLRACKTGFRDKYIMAATEAVLSGRISLDELISIDTDEARKLLMSIQGIGVKVSDCVLLYSLRHRDVFPTDVWVRRIMQYFYFSGAEKNDAKEASINEIHTLASSKFGNNSGLAQQYLFHYARKLKIGL